MTTTALPTDTPFARNRATWLGYALLIYFAFGISLIGPVMPFIADKMGLSYSQIGYHFMVQAAGNLLTSLTGDKVVRRIGNARSGWLGILLMVVSLPGLVFGTTLGLTLFAAFLFGIGSGFVALIAVATLADANPVHAAKAYTEGNIAGGSAVILGPILVGLAGRSALGWQAIAVFPIINLLILTLVFRGLPIPDSPEPLEVESTTSPASSRLPPLFWMFGALLFLGVALEWLITSWSANFLSTVVGYSTSTAAALVSVFAVAVVVGRLIGRRLMVILPESTLLVLSLVWVLLAFPLYWVGSPPALSVVGLFITGLGVANLAPLCMSGAMTAAAQQTNQASARLGLFPSLGNLTMLQLVGFLADRFGMQRAYSVVMVVAIIAIAVALQVNRTRRATGV